MAYPALQACVANNLDGRARQRCLESLRGVQTDAVLQTMVDALEDPNARVRREALSNLRNTTSRIGIPKMLSIVNDPKSSKRMRRDVINALAQVGAAEVIPTLVTRMLALRDSTSQSALWRMRRHLTPDQLNTLLLTPLQRSFSQTTNHSMVRASLKWIRTLKYKAALPFVFDRLNDDPKFVRYVRDELLETLVAFRDPRVIPMLEAQWQPDSLNGPQKYIGRLLHTMGRDISGDLRPLFTNVSAHVRDNAVDLAGDLHIDALTPDLVNALDDINADIQSRALEALGTMNSPASIDALDAVARSSRDLDVRRRALLCLLRQEPSARHTLAFELLDAKPYGRTSSIVSAMATSKDPALVAPMLDRLIDEKRGTPSTVVGFLRAYDTLNDPRALPFLIKAMHRNRNRSALELLSQLADPKTRFIYDLLFVQPGRLNDVAITQGLHNLGSRDHTTLAIERINTPTINLSQRLAAALYLAHLDDPRGLAFFVDVITGTVKVAQGASMPRRSDVYFASQLLGRFDLTAQPALSQRLNAMLTSPNRETRWRGAYAMAFHNVAATQTALRVDLDKKIPFLTEELMPVLRALPEPPRHAVIDALNAGADPFLVLMLEKLR